MPIVVRKSSDRGHANHGWLNTYHTFSFAGYWEPKFDSFGALRVLNEDRVRGGTGFGRHGHANYEIFSYLVSGALEHRDSMGNREVLRRGDVQFTCAGSGIQHSEMNAHASEPVHFLQIWVTPDKRGLKPSYATATFSDDDKHNKLCPLVAPVGKGTAGTGTRSGDKRSTTAIAIHQDVTTYASLLDNDAQVEHKFDEGRAGYIHVVDVKGSKGVTLNDDVRLAPGDGAFITSTAGLTIKGHAAGKAHAEFLLFDLKQPSK